MLLMLLLGIADFGRVFAAGITLEAAARDGAEAAALERLRNPPPTPCDPACLQAYYQALHQLAARTVCNEAALLPNSSSETAATDPATPPLAPGECPDFVGVSGASHDGMPVVRVCVRDGSDPICGSPIPGYGPTVPVDPATGNTRCPAVQAMASAAGATPPSAGEPVSHYIEVGTCYHFTTLFTLNFDLPLGTGLHLGDVWLERTRTFVVDCPPGEVSVC